MLAQGKRTAALYVDKASQQWIVLDPEGHYWVIPSVENPWDRRQPFQPAEATDLVPVPGHYKSMLGLPF